MDEGHQHPRVVRFLVGQEAGEVERVLDLQALDTQPDLPADVGGVVIHRDDVDPPAADGPGRVVALRAGGFQVVEQCNGQRALSDGIRSSYG
jgi:hypothetical protein